MRKEVFNPKKGFTLLELVVSISILMIILTPVLSMVYSTVKTNKEAEDRQNAQALIQKYIEAAKANSIFSLGENKYYENNFEVDENVSQISTYDFPTAQNTTQSAINLSYDATITMDSQNLNVYDNIGNSKGSPISVNGNDMVITIVDNAGGLGLVRDFNVDDTQDVIIPITNLSSNISNINIKVQSSSSYKLNIHVKNYCSGNLNFYCSEADNSDDRIFIINNLGNATSFYNIPMKNTNSNTSTSRVYRIDISVSKAGNLITSGTAYISASD